MNYKNEITKTIEKLRAEFIDNYEKKYAVLDLTFTSVLEMKLGVSSNTARELNELALTYAAEKK